MTLTKADLVRQVYKNHNNLTKAQATDAVEAFFKLSKDTLISGSDLLLSRFGKFNVRDKNPRCGRNPKSVEDLTLDARRVVTFNPSETLRNNLNAGWFSFVVNHLTRSAKAHHLLDQRGISDQGNGRPRGLAAWGL